jgi:putative ABC transport system ATP-binding protein
MEEKLIEFKNITKIYRPKTITEVKALNGLSFTVNKGEFVVICGQSGSGKTTLLNLLGGMDSPTTGAITVAGKAVHKFNEKQLTLYRRRDIGFVFQFYNLMPNLTAAENVEFATEVCKDTLSPMEALQKVGLDNRAKNFPANLSGGEQQRVSIARAIAKRPKLLLCDEPTGALDYETGKKILRLLQTLCREENSTVIVVTHNSALKAMADRVITVKNGLVISEELNKSPKNVEDLEW